MRSKSSKNIVNSCLFIFIVLLLVGLLVYFIVSLVGKLTGGEEPSVPSPAATAAPTPTPSPTPTPEPAYTPSPLDPEEPLDTANLTNPLIIKDGKRVAYLTFDDGPSENTRSILATLKEYGAHATFFVVGKNAEKHPDLIRQMYEEGHTVANHSYCHDYDYIYASVENFYSDILKTQDVIASIIGEENVVPLFRFPGGSFGSKKEPFRTYLEGTDYRFVDWTSLNNDADGKKLTPERALESLRNTIAGREDTIILMHDTAAKTITAETLPQALEYLQSEGFSIEAIRN